MSMLARARLGARSVLVALAILWIALPSARAQRSRFLVRSNPHDWTLSVHLVVKAYQAPLRTDQPPEYDAFNFPGLSVIFPVIDGSASSRTDRAGVRGTLEMNDRVVDNSPTWIDSWPGNVPYHSGEKFGKWELVKGKGREIELDLSIPMTSWETKFDEAQARRVPWPKEVWPDVPRSTFEPQMFIDMDMAGRPYDMTPIRRMVKRWTKGKPKSQPPVVTAKWLTGQVQEYFEPSGLGLRGSRVGEIEGLDLMGAPAAARRGRGSEFDMVTLLTAVLREAGIPARMVIGFDKSEEEENDKFLSKTRGNDRLAAWVEFCLYDEPTNSVTWVPIDIVRLRKRANRMLPLGQEWMYFGTHNELDSMLPFTFNFHPPTRVMAYGSPGFWGWVVENAQPPRAAYQGLSFHAMTTPKRGNQRRKRTN